VFPKLCNGDAAARLGLIYVNVDIYQWQTEEETEVMEDDFLCGYSHVIQTRFTLIFSSPCLIRHSKCVLCDFTFLYLKVMMFIYNIHIYY